MLIEVFMTSGYTQYSQTSQTVLVIFSYNRTVTEQMSTVGTGRQ